MQTLATRPLDGVSAVQDMPLITPDCCDIDGYTKIFAYALIEPQQGGLLLQQRAATDIGWPSHLMLFGGWAKRGESFYDTIQRELGEELEAVLKPQEAHWLGAVSFTRAETATQPQRRALCGLFHWHDRHGMIGRCHEETPVAFPTAQAVTRHDRPLHPVVPNILWRSLRQGLIAR